MLSKGIDRFSLLLFGGFASISLICILAAFYMEEYLLFVVPPAVIFAYFVFFDFKKIFFLLIAMLAISIEMEVGGGFATDMPSEPLMVALMVIFLVYVISRPKVIDFNFLKHPIILMLGIHFIWIGFAALHSVNPFVSFKYMLAKTWYIVVFVFFTHAIINNKAALKKFFWFMYIPLTIMIIQTLIRYGVTKGFAFEAVNEPLMPFFRNHVNYAVMITAWYPFLFLVGKWYRSGTFKSRLITFGKILYPIAIYLSFTRACYLALIAAGLVYIIYNLGMMKWVLRGTVVIGALFIIYLVNDNNYLKFSPEYNKTVQHKQFGDHITATYQLKDVSSMERVYRWVAAFYMSAEKPVTGYGPGNFYPYYKQFTVSSFQTYISDNEERSTVHNYFLLMMVEQGYVGLAIFILLTLVIFHYSDYEYQRSRDPNRKRFILLMTLVLVVIYVNLMLSDMIEVDETGSIYFISISLLVMALVSKDNKPVLKEPTA